MCLEDDIIVRAYDRLLSPKLVNIVENRTSNHPDIKKNRNIHHFLETLVKITKTRQNNRESMHFNHEASGIVIGEEKTNKTSTCQSTFKKKCTQKFKRSMN